MSCFFEDVKTKFANIPEDKITKELCEMYLTNERINRCGSDNYYVPCGMTSDLLLRFLLGKIDTHEVRNILVEASQFQRLLNLYNIHKEEAVKAELGSPEREKHLLAAEAYWTSLEIMCAPITCYEGDLKVIDIDRII